jgi:hypothetical protein
MGEIIARGCGRAGRLKGGERPAEQNLPVRLHCRAKTLLFGLGSKPVSSVPSAFTRAMRLRVVALAAPFGWSVAKLPTSRIFPSACTAMQARLPLTLGSKPVSSVPSAFTRAMRLRVVGLAAPFGWSVVSKPPNRILPSVCTATAFTPESALGSKPISSVPSALSRAILLRATPSTDVNLPTRIIFPSGCTAVAST